MRNGTAFVTVIVVVLGAAVAGAMNCSIISSFQSPAAGQQPMGIDYYNNRLYHAGSVF